MTQIPEHHIAEAATQMVVTIGKLTAQHEVLCRIMAKVVARVPGLSMPSSPNARTPKTSKRKQNRAA